MFNIDNLSCFEFFALLFIAECEEKGCSKKQLLERIDEANLPPCCLYISNLKPKQNTFECLYSKENKITANSNKFLVDTAIRSLLEKNYIQHKSATRYMAENIIDNLDDYEFLIFEKRLHCDKLRKAIDEEFSHILEANPDFFSDEDVEDEFDFGNEYESEEVPSSFSQKIEYTNIQQKNDDNEKLFSEGKIILLKNEKHNTLLHFRVIFCLDSNIILEPIETLKTELRNVAFVFKIQGNTFFPCNKFESNEIFNKYYDAIKRKETR